MATNKGKQEEVLTPYVIDGVPVMVTEKDFGFVQRKTKQAFSVFSGTLYKPEHKGADSLIAHTALSYLKQKFGPDFKMFHGASLEEVHAFIERIMEWEDVTIYPHEDIQYIIMTSMKNEKGIDMEIDFQIFLSGKIITSSVTINILNRAGFRDIDADLTATMDYYASLQAKEVPGSDKAKMVKPEFIADQKLAFGANVVRRKSSVQLSADYAQAAYGLLKETGRSFNPSMNILNEMILVKNKLGMTEEDCQMFSKAASKLHAMALNNIETISKYRDNIQRRAIYELGKRNFKNSTMAANLPNPSQSPDVWRKELMKHAYELWTHTLSEGDRKSLMNQVMTKSEAEYIAMMNDTNNTQLALALAKACENLGENAVMKMAVAEYIRKYSDPEENERGFSILWNIFEDGLVQALHEYEHMDKDVFVYNPPVTELFGFFVHPDADVRAQGLQEVLALKAGDIVTVKPHGDDMVLELKAGLFIAKNKKTLSAFPLAPQGHYFQAEVDFVNPKQQATEGLSIKLRNVKHIAPQQLGFQLTEQAYEFVQSVIAQHGDEQPFFVQEFYVFNQTLHMVVNGAPVPISLVNEQVQASPEPQRVNPSSLKDRMFYCQ